MIGFEVAGTRAFYRPVGRMTLERGVELVAQALRRARDLGLEDILVNTTGVTGFAPPGVFDRYDMATKWVSCAAGGVLVAIVARPELIDLQKIGVLIAQNRGALFEVFPSETAALACLNARLAPRGTRSRLAGNAQRGN